MHTVLPLRFFCNSLSGLLWGHQVFSSPYFLFHYKLLFFSPWYPLVPVEKKYETSLSSLPFLRLRFVLILAKHSLLAIERPVMTLPLFSPFLHMFPLIVTLIKTNERFTSMKHVGSIICHSILLSTVSLYLSEEKDSLFWHYDKYQEASVQLQPLNSIINNNNNNYS